jgi:type VI secretion system secreted protein VgrG
VSASGQRAGDYAPVEVTFKPDPGFDMLFDGLHAKQELGRPFLFTLEVSAGKPQANAPKLIGSTCCIWLYEADDTDQPNRYFHGIVTRVTALGLGGGAYRYRLEIRPWIWLLSQITDCRIFQKQSAFQIITQVFRDAGFSDFKDRRQGGAGDVQLEYCVQYRETSLDFVTRLMEQFGFYYYFTHASDGHTLVITDDPNGHTPLTQSVKYQFDQTEYRTVADHIWRWSGEYGLNTGKWTFRDYNFTMPSADLTAKTVHPEQHQYGSFEIYEYPGPYDTATNGHRLSDVRMQAIIRDRQTFSGESNSRRLLSGWRFKLTDHPDKSFNREYLIIRSTTTVGGVEGTPNPEANSADSYRVQIESIPADRPFRLHQHTPRPMIRGPQTAVVVGKAGEEIATDEYGRIKVRFHWDRSATTDDERTCWIRVAQTWAGGSWGSMFIPRVGQEVVVDFLEGNPDRPLVTGVVYNASNKVPHGLPENKTRSGIVSNSSPGGGGNNELRLEDKAGQEEFYLHASRDFRREVKHDEIGKIDNDRKITITGGNDSLTVASGNHSIDVTAGKSELKAAQSITLSVGSNSITIDNTGVTINGVKIGVQANGALTLSGATIALN